MRYRVTAKVEGNIILKTTVTLDRDDLRFEFRVDDDHRLKEISVSVAVPEDQRSKFTSIIEPTNDPNVKARIKVGGDPQCHQRLVSELQQLESLLSFSSQNALKRVRWDEVNHETIPESDEERDLTPVLSIKPSFSFPEPTTELTEEYIKKLVPKATRYQELTVPQAFLREGWNYYRRFQHVLAFYQFYFVIEDFYADGRSSKKEVLKAFAASAELCQLCQHTLEEILALNQHKGRLRELFDEYGCTGDVAGFQELLFLLRGSLHHFYSRSSRRKATPFNQKKFETVALMTGVLASMAVAEKIVKINKQYGNRD